MKIKYLYTYLIGAACLISAFGIYHLGRLNFLPIWKGGVEDKVFITLPLILFIYLFLIVLEQFLSLFISSISDILNSSDKRSYSAISAIVRSALLPLKGIAMLTSIPLAYMQWGLLGGFMLSLFIGYLYFDKNPVINKFINNKIANIFNIDK